MSIKVIMHDGDPITVPGAAKDVKVSSTGLTVTRDNVVTAQFRRYLAWIEIEQAESSGD